MNKLTNKFLHIALKFINRRSYLRFINGMRNTKEYQQKNLLQTIEILKKTKVHAPKLVNIKNYNDFKELPVASYKDFESDIEKFKINPLNEFCKDIVRFQPTSGSTNNIKWIPYNQSLLDQFDHAASIWLADLAQNYPKILKGKHYWSLSWLPDNLRSEQQIDDSEILSPLKRFFMKKVFAVPQEVMFTKTVEENLFATTCFLIAGQDLSFISVWSPTFLLSIVEIIESKKEEVISVLEHGSWPSQYKINIKAPTNLKQAKALSGKVNYAKLWPCLALISCWDTAQSKIYAEKLKVLFPHVEFQGKGLWATEGVVTLPINGEYLLSYQTHFYEFENLENKEILPSWKLTKGMQVSPIITTSNGLIRYKINDRLLVEGLRGQCPILTFKGRINDTDLVGEKLSHNLVEIIFKKLKNECEPLTLVGVQAPVQNTAPYYLLLANSAKDTTQKDLEKLLCENYHYKLARDLNQLAPAVVFSTRHAYKLYEQLCLNKGMIKGNIKLDILITIQTDEYIHEYK